jgi:hypothetical protein
MRVPARIGAQMHYTLTIPPASRAVDRPTPIDDALVAEARRLLTGALENLPPAAQLNRSGMQTLFAAPMVALCAAGARRGAPVEKLIVAIKLAWASMTEARLGLGDASPDALSAAVTACVEEYFHSAQRIKAD